MSFVRNCKIRVFKYFCVYKINFSHSIKYVEMSIYFCGIESNEKEKRNKLISKDKDLLKICLKNLIISWMIWYISGREINKKWKQFFPNFYAIFFCIKNPGHDTFSNYQSCSQDN